MSNRIDKVNKLVKQELSIALEAYTKELGGLVTVTYVRVSPDLAQANVGISCYKTVETAENILKILNKNTHLLHSDISGRMHLKKIPKMTFRLDTSGEYAERIDVLFNQIKEERDSLQ